MKPLSITQYVRGGMKIARPLTRPRSLADHSRVVNQSLLYQERAKEYAREQAVALGSEQGDRLDMTAEEALELREMHYLSRLDEMEQKTGSD